jgi:hypothetical protein
VNKLPPICISTVGDRNLFAISLSSISTLTALGPRGEHYETELLGRQIDWLTCLINSRDEQATYDLRIISQPHHPLFSRGKLDVVLLCSIGRSTEDQADSRAQELIRLCEAFFEDEYEFSPVSDAGYLEKVRLPFEIGGMAEIARRSELAALDALSGRTRKLPAGFNPRDASPTEHARRSVYHIYPYIPNPVPLDRLCRLMLMQPAPLMVSIRLRPTVLNQAEAVFLDQQIVQCERYAQVSVREPGENLELVHPTLQEQARIFQRRFSRVLYGLKDNAALLRVEIAAPHRVPQTIVDVLGAQLTQPAGGLPGSDNLELYLSGGYEFSHLQGEALTRTTRALENVDLVVDTDPLAPEAGRLRYLFDSAEATAAFRFPAPPAEDLPGLIIKTSRTRLAPAYCSDGGHLIGNSAHNGHEQAVRLSRDDRRRHLYAVGQTGTGKTTMFESMIMADILAGEGLCVIDPHGDLIEKLINKIPKDRAEDVIILDPGDLDRPVGLNLLEYETEAQKYFLIQELIAIVERLLQQVDPAMGGPMFYQHVRMGLLLVMSNPDEPGTLLQFYQVFNSRDFYKRFLPLRSSDPVLEVFVDQTLDRTDYIRQSSDGGSLGGYISSKFEGFVSDPMLRNIFGQQHSTIDVRRALDEGRILLVNLSKGRLGEVNSRFFGMVLIAKLQAAAMARASIPIEQRRDFYVYVDEFQNLATLNFGTLLSEARKYRLNLILTNQYVSQVDPRLTSAIAGNVGTLISFRVGSLDAEYLERDFAPVFNRFDLTSLPNFNTFVSTLIDGQVSKPFSMRTILDETPANEKTGSAVRELSRLKYGKVRSEVEREIGDSLLFG